MAHIDFYLQSFIFCYALPLVMILFITQWYFDITTRLKVKVMKLTHHKLLQEKEELFRQIDLIRTFDDKRRPERSRPKLEVLEIGVGSGNNFWFYPKRSLVTCLDPNLKHKNYVYEHLKSSDRKLSLKIFVEECAEDMTELNSNEFDAVICTLTLCSVNDPGAVLEEVRRVLKPGGKFFFLEHVGGSKKSFVRWIQDRLQRVWSHFSGGCQLNRETWKYLDQSNFSKVSYQYSSGSLWFVFVRPWIYGIAVK